MAPGIIIDVDGALLLSAIQQPIHTLWNRIGPNRDQRSVQGISGIARLVAREFPDAPVRYITSAPRILLRSVRRALGVDGYPPGQLHAPARITASWRDRATDHKRNVLRSIMDTTDRSWILLGDDAGPDPALFTHAAASGNVAAIALWHHGEPATSAISRVRATVGNVPVLTARTGEVLADQLATTFGLGHLGIDDWFLTGPERGNIATSLSAWTEGNDVQALVDGRAYLNALGTAVKHARAGDSVQLTGWRADVGQILNDAAASQALTQASRRGVTVRALVWRSHSSAIGFAAATNRRFAKALAGGGGHALLDHRVRAFGSHHQKAVTIRHAANPERDVAFVGGIDIAASRRDDPSHKGDRFKRDFAPVYGATPAWHDVQVQLKGPAVSDVERTFRERWHDPAPLARAPWRVAVDAWAGLSRHADPLPPQGRPPPVAGTSAVQILRTYPRRHPALKFAPAGERSIARAYSKALTRAQRLVYVEDQYLWSEDVARVFAAALHRAPDLHIIAVVPRHPDQESPIKVPAARFGRGSAMDLVRRVGGDRVQILDLDHEDDAPIYVHDKLCIIDDVWAAIGSANLNRRSWTHDSELAAAVLDDQRDHREPLDPAGLGDGARRFARDLRLRLMREHLGRSADDDADLLDPQEATEVIRSASAALDHWHATGQPAPRPAGRLRVHPTLPTPRWWSRLTTSVFYQAVFDPDGRPFGMRARRTF